MVLNKSTMEIIISENDVLVLVVREWLTFNYAQNLHDRLKEEVPWIHGKITLSEKIINIPRAMFFLGDEDVKEYNYSRSTFPVQSWNGHSLYQEIETIRNNICNDDILQPNLSFNSCLINLYRYGNDKINPHSDREALGIGNTVITISLLKSKNKELNGKYRRIEIKLYNGDLLLMAGKCQELWTHNIPREQTLESRISLTYRLIR